MSQVLSMAALIININSYFKKHKFYDVDSYGKTKLHYAAIYDITHLVDSILTEGVNINARDNNGWTALHYAAKNSSVEVIDLLLYHNANPVIRDAQGYTPLWIALLNSCGNYKAVKRLLKAEAKHDNKRHTVHDALYFDRITRR